MSWLKRILLNSLLLIAILFLPWYISVVLGIAIYSRYALPEILFFAMIMDIYYDSSSLSKLGPVPLLPFTIGAAIAIVIIDKVKSVIRYR